MILLGTRRVTGTHMGDGEHHLPVGILRRRVVHLETAPGAWVGTVQATGAGALAAPLRPLEADRAAEGGPVGGVAGIVDGHGGSLGAVERLATAPLSEDYGTVHTTISRVSTWSCRAAYTHSRYAV